jgi:Family of unknown function (DUF6516)
MNPQAYLTEIKAKLVSSSIIISIAVVEEYTLPDRGYFRARLRLGNNDFLEVAEYFVLEDAKCVTRRYRYQWMDQLQQVIRKRWDNVEHYPNLPNFPYHTHVGEESIVEPGQLVSIVELLDILEQVLSSSGTA